MMEFTQLEDIDPQTTLTIFQILFWIEDRNKEYGELLLDITFALCEKVGSIDNVRIVCVCVCVYHRYVFILL